MLLRRILNSKNTIWYLLLLAFLVRLALVMVTDPTGSDTVDGFDYHNHAIALLNGEVYPSHGSLPFMRPPLYPMLLAAVYYFVPHDTYITARVLNAILDVAACFVFYKLILLIWNNRVIALLSILVYAINPLILFFTVRVRVESLFALLLVSALYLIVKVYKEQFSNALWFFPIGVLLGLATLTRPNALMVIGLMPFWLIFVNWRKWNKITGTILWLVLGCCISILPWTARNYHQYGELILVNDAFGYSFWISNSDLKVEDLRAKSHLEYLDADRRLWQETSAIEKTLEGQSLTARQKHYTGLGIEYIQNNFSAWLWLNVGKFLEFWSPMGHIDMQGWKAVFTLPFGLLMLIGVFSFFGKFRDKAFDRNVWLLFAILIVSATISGVLNWSSIRYRIPMVDAYVIPFCLSWIVNKSGKVAGRAS